MINILIVTHERIGEAYRALAHHFFSDIPSCIGLLGVEKTEDHEDVIARIREEIAKMPTHDGVLVLTDIFGATPCNAARKLTEPNKIAMLTGLNAPMMIKAIQYAPQANDLVEFTATVRQAAINGIFEITMPSEM